MKNILIIFALSFLFFSCEEVPVKIPEFQPITSGKVVLVEELTGVSCSNCPAGAARLASIQELYPDNVVVVGIHGILLAEPLPESKYDFRNDDAVELESWLGNLPKPSAVVNRIRFEELFGGWGILVTNQWQTFIEKELEKDQVINLGIAKTYNADTRELEITVNALPLVDLSGDFKVTVLLTEGEIIDPQLDPNTTIQEYEHNHVLREVITEVTGDFFANELVKNELTSKTYKFTLPDDGDGLWNPEHLEIVSFIADTEGVNEDVLQAVQVHVVD